MLTRLFLFMTSIAKDTSYEDKVSNNSRLTEYGVLVKHKGNCQGYSLAYAAVMEELGILVCISLIRSIWIMCGIRLR